jgi:hypothetical protein
LYENASKKAVETVVEPEGNRLDRSGASSNGLRLAILHAGDEHRLVLVDGVVCKTVIQTGP